MIAKVALIDPCLEPTIVWLVWQRRSEHNLQILFFPLAQISVNLQRLQDTWVGGAFAADLFQFLVGVVEGVKLAPGFGSFYLPAVIKS
jgi:hypothetical protein